MNNQHETRRAILRKLEPQCGVPMPYGIEYKADFGREIVRRKISSFGRRLFNCAMIVVIATVCVAIGVIGGLLSVIFLAALAIAFTGFLIHEQFNQ